LTDSDYANAAKLAAKTPGDDLRNAETIARFQALPTTQGQASPVNAIESIELVRPVLHQNKKHLLEKW
jgi:clathrin heavy chain